MCYSAMTVARYLIERSGGNKTPMQLNKLTYIAHGWGLAIYNEPLIVEEIEAWKYGPVIPVLYHEFKRFGGNTVPHRPILETSSILDKDKELLEKIIDVYGHWSGLQLSAKTHEKGTPWYQTRKWYNTVNPVIPNKLIKEYYIKKAKQSVDGN